MKTSQAGIDFIKAREAFRGSAYKPTPNDVWTIGYGFTNIGGRAVENGDMMTQADADRTFPYLLAPYEDAVYANCTHPPTQNQFDSMVSLAWNIGIHGFLTSTVLKCHNQGDTVAAAKAFSLWNKQAGQVLPGLVSRRALEAALYLEPAANDDPRPVAQTIDPEPTFMASRINKSGIVAGATTGLTMATEVANNISGFKTALDGLGNWITPILLGVVFLAVGYMVLSRIQMRKEGTA